MKTILRLLLFLVPFTAAAQSVANYTFTQTSGSFTQIQSTAGAVSPAMTSGTLDEGYYNAVPIGFTFVYEGNSYTTISASSNGWMRLGGTLSSAIYTNNLSTGTPRPVIAPLWDDLAFSATGSFTYKLTGTTPNRVFTAEWLNMKWDFTATAPGISFQVKLYESNKRIEFVYRQEAGVVTANSASIGLAGLTSGNFLSVNGTGMGATASSSTETTTNFGKPATGNIFRFDPYVLLPAINSFSPSLGPIGTTVTISGSNFDPAVANNVVYFGAVKATVLTASTTSLTVSVPPGTTYKEPTVMTVNSHLTAFADQAFDVTFCSASMSSSSFGSAVAFNAASGSRVPNSGDFDGDGKTDVCVSTNSGVVVFRNTATNGTINASTLAAGVGFSTSFQCGEVQTADLDGDGKLDIISSNYNTGGQDSISLLRNTASVGVINSSSFAPKVNIKVGHYPTVKIGDIDGDGKPELVSANEGAATLSVFRNVSTPGVLNTSSFSAAVNFTAIGNPWDLELCDIDGDGKTDAVTGSSSTNVISVFRNTATSGVINASSFAARVDFALPNGTSSIRVADFDGDGKTDVIATCQSSSCISVFRNTSTAGSVSFATRVDISVGMGPTDIDVNDLNGDGKPDVALVGSSVVRVLQNTGTPGNCSFASYFTVPVTSNPYNVHLADMDNDGRPELMVTDLSGGQVLLCQNLVTPLSAIVPVTANSITSACDDGTWQTFYNPLNPVQVVAAIKDNGNNLGTITVDEYNDPAPGYYNSVRYLQRHFRILVGTQPSSSVQVRLYFTNAELASLQAVDPSVVSAANLTVTKYDGPTEDGTYYPNDATSLIAIPPASITNGTAYGGKYLEFTVSSFSEFWIHGQSGVLPIELLNFSAEPDGNHVQLNWSTASEENNDFFTVERTADGLHFETVAIVDGAGNSTQPLNYTTTDWHPLSGTSYYRLKQTDFNGRYSYSEIVVVHFEEEGLFSVFPNPSDGEIHVYYPGDAEEPVTVTITDIAGREVVKEQTTIGALQQETFYLPSGAYSIIITGETLRRVKVFMVNKS